MHGGINLKIKKILVMSFLLISFLSFASIQTTDITMNFEKTLEGTVTIPYIYGLENLPTEDFINEKIMRDLRPFIRDLSAWAEEAEAEEAEADSKNEGWDFREYQIYTDYEIYHTDGELLSFTIDYYQYTGGAHGMTFRHSYNYNLKTGKELALNDLFKNQFDYSPIILTKINEKISEEPDLYFVESIDYLEPDVNFYVTEEKMVIYFPLYEIAPYCVGFPGFEIPLEQLKEGLAINIKATEIY